MVLSFGLGAKANQAKLTVDEGQGSSKQLPNNDKHNNHEAMQAVLSLPTSPLALCDTEGGAPVGGRDLRSEAASESQREMAAAFPPRRVRIDCEVKKKRKNVGPPGST